VEAALRLMAGRGHQRAGLLIERQHDVYHRLFEQAWRAAAPTWGIDGAGWIAECAERAEAEAIARDWLSRPGGATAILCVGDRPGFGAGAAAARSGRVLGRDFDLLVAGSAAHRGLYDPGIWCFAIDHEAIGRRAAAALLGALDGQPGSGAVRLLPELVQL
jgi:DNA-binding LacI/PurR family transcriptional regulator